MKEKTDTSNNKSQSQKKNFTFGDDEEELLNGKITPREYLKRKGPVDKI